MWGIKKIKNQIPQATNSTKAGNDDHDAIL